MHTCHAKGCPIVVPPRLLMCAPHWGLVPPTLQRRVLVTYRQGQEIDKKPSEAWRKAAQAAIAHVAEIEGIE